MSRGTSPNTGNTDPHFIPKLKCDCNPLFLILTPTMGNGGSVWFIFNKISASLLSWLSTLDDIAKINNSVSVWRLDIDPRINRWKFNFPYPPIWSTRTLKGLFHLICFIAYRNVCVHAEIYSEINVSLFLVSPAICKCIK